MKHHHPFKSGLDSPASDLQGSPIHGHVPAMYRHSCQTVSTQFRPHPLAPQFYRPNSLCSLCSFVANSFRILYVYCHGKTLVATIARQSPCHPPIFGQTSLPAATARAAPKTVSTVLAPSENALF